MNPVSIYLRIFSLNLILVSYVADSRREAL